MLVKSFRFAGFLSLAAFIFSSCAPKDDKLIRPDSNPQLKAESIASDVSVKLAFASFDRMLEAVSYLKVLLNPAFAAEKKLNADKIFETATQIQWKITSPRMQNENDNFLQTSQVNLLAVVTKNEAQEITSVLIKDDSGGLSKTELFTKANGKMAEHAAVVLVSKNKRYLFTKAAAAGIFSVEVDAVDSIKSFSRKNLNEVYSDTLSQVSVQASVYWDGKGESLDQKIRVISAAPEYQPQLSKVRTQLVSDEILDLTVSINECANFEGQISLTSVKTKVDTVLEKQILVFSKLGVLVSGKAFNSKWVECATRPLVDLTTSL